MKLSLSAIKGYRSMLSFVFKSRLPQISSSPVIRDLLKSFHINRPIKRNEVLGWDVNKVLNALRSPPFEPLQECPLRKLTQKCIFLVALATAKRIGELQALSYKVVKKSPDLILSYLPHFIAKTESAANPVPRAFPLKSLKDFVGNLEEELTVCPVRCLKFYLNKTCNISPRPKTLFVSPRNQTRPLSKNAISFFLRDLITKFGLPQNERNSRPRAHSIRAMAASLAFHKNCPVDKIIETATWRTNSVFSSFYLKDLAFEHENLNSLSPVVVAGQVTGPSQS